VADCRATLFTLQADVASSTSVPRQKAAKAAALRHEGGSRRRGGNGILMPGIRVDRLLAFDIWHKHT
ncbi:MAG: hypothetical protein KAT75_05985, partial [Dehalococcoidia bacterium]|nr:hypothetical protein [Dehalococcoidia bacterium]